MKLQTLAAVTVLLTAVATPLKAASPKDIQLITPIAQAQPKPVQVDAACTQNRAESLPNPFTDVSPDHWAFKAVMSMYYCGPGPFNKITPPAQSQQSLTVSQAQ